MSIRYITGESRSEEERRFCPRCDPYRGYVCAEHRLPSYEKLAEEMKRLRDKLTSLAQRIASDYPDVGKIDSHEQLYAIACSYDGCKAANDDLHKLIEAMSIHLGWTYDRVVELADSVRDKGIVQPPKG